MVDLMERRILACMYIAGVGGRRLDELIYERIAAPKDHVDSAVARLVKGGMVCTDGSTLTGLGRGSLRVVLAGGVFDIIHPGHIHTLSAARSLGDVLVVVVATDNTAVKMKKRRPIHSQTQRQELVDALEMVDCSLVGREGDIFETVRLVGPQVIALGYDQAHQERFIVDGCRRIGLDAQVARLQSPIPESSSSKIESDYGESIHGI